MIIVAILIGILMIFGLVVFRGAPYLPSQARYVRQALSDLYPIGPNDVLVDVGSGDGIVLRIAAEKGAIAIGYELNPILVVISRFLSRNQPKVRVYLADFWNKTLPDTTTIVYSFAVMRDALKLKNKMQTEANRLQRPIYLLSYGNHLPLKPTKVLAAYFLYTFYPLQPEKAQV